MFARFSARTANPNRTLDGVRGTAKNRHVSDLPHRVLPEEYTHVNHVLSVVVAVTG